MENIDLTKKTKRELIDLCLRCGGKFREERRCAREELARRGVPQSKIPYIQKGGTNAAGERSPLKGGRENGDRRGRPVERPDRRGPDRDRNRNERRRSPPMRFDDQMGFPSVDSAFLQGLSFATIFPDAGPAPNMGPNFGPMNPFGPVPSLMPPMGLNQPFLPNFGMDGPLMPSIPQGPAMNMAGPPVMREESFDRRGLDNGGRPNRDRSAPRQRNGNDVDRRGNDGERRREGGERRRDAFERRGDLARREGAGRSLGDRARRDEQPPKRFEREDVGRSRSPIRSREKVDDKKKLQVRVTRQGTKDFNERDLTVFGEALFDVIRETSGPPPRIEDTVRAGASLVITCADEYSMRWLLRYVPQISMDGQWLNAALFEEHPVFHLVFPYSVKPARELLHMLETFNEGLKTSDWVVRGSEQRNNTVVLAAAIPPSSARYLQMADFKLFFGLQPVRVTPQ